MAAPKKKPTTATPGYTPKVNPSTGFTTGVRTVKRANKMSAGIKPIAPRGTSTGTRPRPSPPPKSKSLIDQIGGGIQDRLDLISGKKKTPISNAMKVTKTGPTSWKAKK